MRYRFARPEGTRAAIVNALPLRYMSAFTKRSGKNVRFVRFYPPPPLDYYTKGDVPKIDYYTKGDVLFAFAEAVAAGRRPGSATGSGAAGCLHACMTDIVPHSCYGVRPGLSQGMHPQGCILLLGKRCLNQDFRDLWIDRMAGDGPIPIRWVSSHRLKRHTAVAQ